MKGTGNFEFKKLEVKKRINFVTKTAKLNVLYTLQNVYSQTPGFSIFSAPDFLPSPTLWFKLWSMQAVLWIHNFLLRIRIQLFNEFRIRIRVSKSSGSGFGSYRKYLLFLKKYDFKGPIMERTLIRMRSL
jgi:hypothetical protein